MRAARGVERGERRVDRAIVVIEPARELVLVVADDARVRRRDQQPQADRRRHLAVGEVMHDLARGPLARRRRGRAPRRSRRRAPRRRRGSRPCRRRSAAVASPCPSSVPSAFCLVLTLARVPCAVALAPRLRDSRARRLPGRSARGDARSGDRAAARTLRPACRRTRSSSRSCSAIAPHSAIGPRFSTWSQYSRPYSMTPIFFDSLSVCASVRISNSSSQRAEAARKDHQRLGQVREPELAHEEVVELEVQPVGDVRVGALLERQPDVQADRLAAGLVRAAVGRLHDAGAAARGRRRSGDSRDGSVRLHVVSRRASSRASS